MHRRFKQMFLSWMCVLCCTVAPAQRSSTAVTTTSCPVTIGRKSPISAAEFIGAGSAHWNGSLYVGALWPDGTIVFRRDGAGYVYPDGSVGMTIAWYRGDGAGRQIDNTEQG